MPLERIRRVQARSALWGNVLFNHRYAVRVLFVAGWLQLLAGASAADESTPVGFWRTVDDKTGEQAGLIEITQMGDELEGHIVNIIPPPGDPDCRTCDSALQGRRLIGKTILKGFKRDGDVWDGGTITDPRTGFVYSSELRLVDDGKKLLLRGYLFIPLLGRTTVWLRAE